MDMDKTQMIAEISKRFKKLPVADQLSFADPYVYCAVEYHLDGWTPEDGPGIGPVEGQKAITVEFEGVCHRVDQQTLADEVADRMSDNLWDMMDEDVADYLGELRALGLVMYIIKG